MQDTVLHRLVIKSSSLVVICACFLTACSTYSDEDKKGFERKIQQYIHKKNWHISESSGSGLFLEVLQEGNGDESVQFSSEVTIAYKGTFLNGKIFDQTEPGKPLRSNLNGLIMGFQEGLIGQKKGAKMRFIVPPQLGYGDEKTGEIPPNSILVYEVELLEVY